MVKQNADQLIARFVYTTGLSLDFIAGTDIHNAKRMAGYLALRDGDVVTFGFNGTIHRVDPNEIIEGIK